MVTYLRGALSTSLNAINKLVLPWLFDSRKGDFFWYLSPVWPERIASTGENFFTSFVQRKANKRITTITRTAPSTDSRKEYSVSSTILLLTVWSSMPENGILNKKPTTAPATASMRYFIRYRLRILKLLMPIAFITPISRNSPEIVNVMENFNTTKETIIRQILRISMVNAITISRT